MTYTDKMVQFGSQYNELNIRREERLPKKEKSYKKFKLDSEKGKGYHMSKVHKSYLTMDFFYWAPCCEGYFKEILSDLHPPPNFEDSMHFKSIIHSNFSSKLNVYNRQQTHAVFKESSNRTGLSKSYSTVLEERNIAAEEALTCMKEETDQVKVEYESFSPYDLDEMQMRILEQEYSKDLLNKKHEFDGYNDDSVKNLHYLKMRKDQSKDPQVY